VQDNSTTEDNPNSLKQLTIILKTKMLTDGKHAKICGK